MVSEEDHPADGKERAAASSSSSSGGSVHVVVVGPAAGGAAAAAAAGTSAGTTHASPLSGSKDDPDSLPEDGWNPGVNQDEAIKAQEQEIEREIAERSALIGERIGLEVLLSEYPADDMVYRRKIQDLKSVYGSMRKSRPDGNCFFRAFGFSLFHSLLGRGPEIERLSGVGRSVLQDLHSLGFSFTVDDFHDVFQDALSDLRSGRVTTPAQLLQQVFNDNSRSDYLVVFLRLVTSAHLQKHSDFFQAFVEDGMSVKEFCAHEVEPMYKESDHMHVIAVTSATGVGVRINYLDRGGSADKINTHDFPEGVQDPPIHLLYRPGHYDVLYPKDAPAQEPADASVSSSSAQTSSSSSSVATAAAAAPPPAPAATSAHMANGGSADAGSAVAAGADVSSSCNSAPACEGVSSSKNPRLDPSVSSTGCGNEDSNEPSTTS